MSSGIDDQTLFRGLLEAEPDAIVDISTDRLGTYATAQTKRLSGYNRSDLTATIRDITERLGSEEPA
jgi:PAS domain-containing protein